MTGRPRIIIISITLLALLAGGGFAGWKYRGHQKASQHRNVAAKKAAKAAKTKKEESERVATAERTEHANTHRQLAKSIHVIEECFKTVRKQSTEVNEAITKLAEHATVTDRQIEQAQQDFQGLWWQFHELKEQLTKSQDASPPPKRSPPVSKDVLLQDLQSENAAVAKEAAVRLATTPDAFADLVMLFLHEKYTARALWTLKAAGEPSRRFLLNVISHPRTNAPIFVDTAKAIFEQLAKLPAEPLPLPPPTPPFADSFKYFSAPLEQRLSNLEGQLRATNQQLAKLIEQLKNRPYRDERCQWFIPR